MSGIILNPKAGESYLPIDYNDLTSATNVTALFTSGAMTNTEYRSSAKFTYAKSTAPAGHVDVGGGATHVKFLRWDGSWSSVKAISGYSSFAAGDWGAATAAPYNSNLIKFGAICPCDVSGVAVGSLTFLALGNNQLTSFSSEGLGSLTFLALDYNQLTSFSGEGLGSLNYLSLEYNQLTSFSGEGFDSLIVLQLGNNQLTSFSSENFDSLTYLSIGHNQLTSFSGEGFDSLTKLHIGDNQLTSFSGKGLSSVTDLNISNNQLTSIDMAGIILSYQNHGLGSTFADNLLDGPALDALYTSLGEDLGATGVILVSGNPGTATDDPTIATAKGYTVSGT